MKNGYDIPALRQTLRERGAINAVDPRGKRLFIVLSPNLAMEERGVLLAVEGEGAKFFQGDRPLNRFRLVEAGFSLMVAPQLSDLVNALLFGTDEEATADTPRQITAQVGTGD